jgi:F-type H+-transporting ATPase subunit epsilon
MLPDSIELIIVTPERQFLREKVVEVVLPGAEGELGVLPGHAPLMTELGIGELSYRGAGSNPSGALAIIQGFAERAAEIDLARAEAAKARAEQHLAASDPNIDWDRASIALQRALIRIQVARKYRGAPVETL